MLVRAKTRSRDYLLLSQTKFPDSLLLSQTKSPDYLLLSQTKSPDYLLLSQTPREQAPLPAAARPRPRVSRRPQASTSCVRRQAGCTRACRACSRRQDCAWDRVLPPRLCEAPSLGVRDPLDELHTRAGRRSARAEGRAVQPEASRAHASAKRHGSTCTASVERVR
eukprot:6212517-Pleurochrysis_carterae.AAC.1